MNIYRLEDRVLYDAAAASDAEAAEALAATVATDGNESGDSSGQSETSDDCNTLAVVDAVSESQEPIDSVLESSMVEADGGVHVLLISDAVEGASALAESASSDTIVILYDADSTTAEQLLADLVEALNGQQASSIGIIAKSDSDGDVDLLENDSDTAFWQGVSDYMTNDARIDFFSSDLDGSSYVDQVASITGHEVAYSTDTTGTEGDWLLEVGDINLEAIYFGGDAPDVTLTVDDASDITLVVIDSAVMNADEIVDDFDDNTEILYLDADSELSGLDQINAYLEASGRTYDSISIITHGNDGSIVLVGDIIDSDYATENADEFAELGSYLSDDGDIMLYSCNTTESSAGEDFVDLIANLTGADVAASNDSTTNADNGDWDLEYTSGIVTADALTVEGYDYHLESFYVISNADTGTEGTLRYYVNLINNNSSTYSGSEIVFALSSGDETITLSSTLTISVAMAIDGTNNSSYESYTGSGTPVSITANGSFSVITVTSANIVVIENLTVQGYGSGGVLVSEGAVINNSGTLTLENVTVTNGYAQYGGGIYNTGTLTLTDSIVELNIATTCGGGIYSTGTLTVSNSDIKSNSISGESISLYTGASGCGIYNSGSLTVSNSEISGNSAEVSGIYVSVTVLGCGIFNFGSLTVQDCDISNNFATITNVLNSVSICGCGICNYGEMVVSGSVISSNSATSDITDTSIQGCGIYNSGSGTSYIISSTIADHSSGTIGGGIYTTATLYLINSTVAGNSATVLGGGIYTASTMYMANSIVAYNYSGGSGSHTYDDIYIVSSNIVYAYYSVFGTVSGNITGIVGNTSYTYSVSGLGAALFVSYNQVGTENIYTPELAADGTIAIVSDSVATGSGCLTGSCSSGYAYSPDHGTKWYVIDGTEETVATGVSQNTTDQRGLSIIVNYPSIGAYQYDTSSAYYKSDANGIWSELANWQVSYDGGTSWIDAVQTPTSANSVSIEIASNIIVNADLTIDQTVLDSGYTLTVSDGVVLTVADGAGIDLGVYGTILLTGTVSTASGVAVSFYNDSMVEYGWSTSGDAVYVWDYYNLTLNGIYVWASGTAVRNVLTIDGTLTSAYTLNKTEVITITNNGTLILTGAATLSGYSSIAGTVEYSGTQQIASMIFENLIISGTNSWNTGITVNDTLTISGTLTTDYTLDQTSIDVLTNNGILILDGAATLSGYLSIAGTVNYSGTQQIASMIFENLIVSGTNSWNTGITVNNTLTISGTLTTNYTLNQTSIDVLTNNGTLILGGTAALSGFTSISGIVEYTGSQEIVSMLYENLVLTGTNSWNTGITVSDTLTINGTLTSNYTLNQSSVNAITNNGNLILTGTATLSGYSTVSGTVEYAGGDQMIAEMAYETLELSGSATTKTFATGTTTISAGITVADNMTISGSGGSIIEAVGGAFSVISVNAGIEVTILNLTVKGYGSGSIAEGGCINNAGNLILENVTITNGYASNGGGIYNAGTLVLVNCTVCGNEAANAGGGCYNTDTFYILSSTISGNSASSGGGIYSSGGSTYIVSSIVAYNNADYVSYDDIWVAAGDAYVSYSVYGTVSSGTLSSTYESISYSYGSNGKGAALFSSYESLADGIWAPLLAYNGGNTLTLALASDSIAVDAGCLTGSYEEGATKYAYSADGTTWYSVDNGTILAGSVAVTSFSTDQAGHSRTAGSVDVGAVEFHQESDHGGGGDSGGDSDDSDSDGYNYEYEYADQYFSNPLQKGGFDDQVSNELDLDGNGASLALCCSFNDSLKYFEDMNSLGGIKSAGVGPFEILLDRLPVGTFSSNIRFMTPIEKALMYLAG